MVSDHMFGCWFRARANGHHTSNSIANLSLKENQINNGQRNETKRRKKEKKTGPNYQNNVIKVNGRSGSFRLQLDSPPPPFKLNGNGSILDTKLI